MIRIGASTYLNSAPLVYSFSRGRFRDKYAYIGDAAPSRCAAMLASGECDIALIPVIEYQRIPDLEIIPEVSVASKSRVRSVILASRKPLDEVRTLALDTSSRTSQALVKILFSKRYGFLPEFIERTPDARKDFENMLESCDAALVIGDPAMKLAAAASGIGVEIFDLAEEWRSLTGLPFVFAVWALREGFQGDKYELVRDFIAAKDEGIEHLDLLASDYSSILNMPKDDLLSYLSYNVNYDLDEQNIAGMMMYFRHAKECGLIPEARKVKFAGRQTINGMAQTGF